MYTRTIKDLKLNQIEESGQCFRFIEISNPRILKNSQNPVYRTIFCGKYLEMSQSNDEITFSCDEKEFNEVWAAYFDLETDYGKIKSMIDSKDEFLSAAANYGDGIRILRQDLWEMMVSFIISQRKSIPAIRSSVESLCRAYGEKIDLPEGEAEYGFPTAESLYNVPFEELKNHALGYRDKYISRLASDVVTGKIVLDDLKTMTPDEAVNEMMKIFGVGIKVANCVSLFGLHNIDAFPEDVWIKRIIAEKYDGFFDKNRYKGVAGVIQQYMFFYGRTNK